MNRTALYGQVTDRARWAVVGCTRCAYQGGVTGHARMCGYGLKHDVRCGHTAWLAACIAKSSASRGIFGGIFGDRVKLSTAKRMMPCTNCGETARWPRRRRRRAVEKAVQHADG